jgi:hypothetical protein
LTAACQNSQEEALRKMLRERIPPFSDDNLVRNLCEEVIGAFGSLYPDKPLNVCMRLAHRISVDGEVDEPGRASAQRKGARGQRIEGKQTQDEARNSPEAGLLTCEC